MRSCAQSLLHTQPYYTHRLQGKIPFLFFYFKSQRSYVLGIYLSTFSFYLFISLLLLSYDLLLTRRLSDPFFILQGSRIFDEMSSRTKETTTLLQGKKIRKPFGEITYNSIMNTCTFTKLCKLVPFVSEFLVLFYFMMMSECVFSGKSIPLFVKKEAHIFSYYKTMCM